MLQSNMTGDELGLCDCAMIGEDCTPPLLYIHTSPPTSPSVSASLRVLQSCAMQTALLYLMFICVTGLW